MESRNIWAIREWLLDLKEKDTAKSIRQAFGSLLLVGLNFHTVLR